MTGVPYRWTPVANHSISIARQSSVRQCWSVLACIFLIASHGDVVTGVHFGLFVHKVMLFLRLKYQRGYFLYQNRSLIIHFENAYLSSNSYNFWMQPNIAMKFTEYVAWILLWKYCKFGEKIYYSSRDVEFLLGDYFFGASYRKKR